ncbi:Hypp9232 [Branchiostoma lanceolatum]|uniref:Hypp9232 protein n=1 Tax=Branchiostoma lanceolatum TaxID=7740 RepID=A0A8J9ZEG1_BRALA|nr:Hypp9232 [Branchiostoma lanceolatum]
MQAVLLVRDALKNAKWPSVPTVTAASAVPRVTTASLAAPTVTVAVTTASEGKQTHKYYRRLRQNEHQQRRVHSNT